MADHYLKELLGDRESIILVSRQHWFVILPSIIGNVVLTLLIGAASTAIYIVLLLNPLAFLLLGLLGIPIVRFIDRYMNWRNEEYVITNFRVIRLEGVFSKNVIDSSLDKVNDVMLVQTFFGRLFKYGDIEILTASELGVNKIKKILDPIHFKTAMLNAKESLEHQSLPSMEPIQEAKKEDILGMISKLDQLHLTGALSDDEFMKKKTELLAKL